MALRSGQVQILLATDVAARGIDVPSITHVFNYGLPMKSEDYVHRIGRTGRAGRDGLAVTLAEFRDQRKIQGIEAYTRQPLQTEVIPGLEPSQRLQPARKPQDRRGGGKGRSDHRGGNGWGQERHSQGRGDGFKPRGDGFKRKGDGAERQADAAVRAPGRNAERRGPMQIRGHGKPANGPRAAFKPRSR